MESKIVVRLASFIVWRAFVLKANEEVDDDAELRELGRQDPTVIKKFDLVRDERGDEAQLYYRPQSKS